MIRRIGIDLLLSCTPKASDSKMLSSHIILYMNTVKPCTSTKKGITKNNKQRTDYSITVTEKMQITKGCKGHNEVVGKVVLHPYERSIHWPNNSGE